MREDSIISQESAPITSMVALGKKLLELIGRQSSSAIFIESHLFAILCGVLDYLSGYEVSMFVFYGIPILAVAWWCDRRRALFLATVCAFIWWLADSLTGHFYRHQWIRVWEPTTRYLYFGFVALAGSALKRQHTAVIQRIALLEHSRRLEQQIIEISEREQRRIGRDLHDGLCQYFAAVACAAASLKSDLRALGLKEEAALASEVTDLVEQGVIQTRDLARGLMPVQMYEAGLAAALDQLAASVSRLQNVTCLFGSDGEPSLQSSFVATHLYRIAQEAIQNAIRHGDARTIQIHLGAMDTIGKLCVIDDGSGISQTQNGSGGMGLNIMNYRARVIGGELRVSEPGTGGTVVTCTFPRTSPVAEITC